jgi:oxygen-dependent protoporphyrinogen oxidase
LLDAIVLGGGISGLVAALELQRSGSSVRLLEASDRLGGVIRSRRVDGFLVEHGPNTVLATSGEIARLLESVGLTERLEWGDASSNKRFVVRGGRLRPVPTSPPGFLGTRLFHLGAKMRLLREPFIKPSGPDAVESLADFVLRRLGREFLDYAINPFVSGVYAGRPEELEVRTAFPKVWELEQRYGSLIGGAIKGARERKARAAAGEVAKDRARLFSFPDGNQELPEAIGRALQDAASTGLGARAVQAIPGGFRVLADGAQGPLDLEARAVVAALPQEPLLALWDDPDLKPLGEVPYPPLAVVFTGWRGEPGGRPRDGFGFLVPEVEKRSVLGTLWNSSLFPGRCPLGGAALTSFVGGRRAPELATLPEDQLLARVRADLRDLMGIERAPDFVFVERYDRAIPQYTLGHHARLQALARFEAAHPGVFVASNLVGGVSVGDRIRFASALAGRVQDFLRQP